MPAASNGSYEVCAHTLALNMQLIATPVTVTADCDAWQNEYIRPVRGQRNASGYSLTKQMHLDSRRVRTHLYADAEGEYRSSPDLGVSRMEEPAQ